VPRAPPPRGFRLSMGDFAGLLSVTQGLRFSYVAELETTEYATTERGKKITHSQDEVDHALTLLAEAGAAKHLQQASSKKKASDDQFREAAQVAR
jgi:hypothetical protein